MLGLYASLARALRKNLDGGEEVHSQLPSTVHATHRLLPSPDKVFEQCLSLVRRNKVGSCRRSECLGRGCSLHISVEQETPGVIRSKGTGKASVPEGSSGCDLCCLSIRLGKQ